jgi:hypothetical protein
MEKLPFIVAGFDNLKTAIEPMRDEDEKTLLVFLLEELNNPVNLCMDIVCDRYMDHENDVFLEEHMDCTDLVLIGASHLSEIMRHLDTSTWKITDLTRPGWRITVDSVAELINNMTSSALAIDWNTATVILQLFDNSMYMVGGPGGKKKLPAKDRQGIYHIDSSLVVADKPTVRELVFTLSPLLKRLGAARKLFLTPLARYWVAPCCSDALHFNNYRLPGFLPRLGDAIHALRDGSETLCSPNELPTLEFCVQIE